MFGDGSCTIALYALVTSYSPLFSTYVSLHFASGAPLIVAHRKGTLYCMYIYFLTVWFVCMLLHPSRLLEPGLFVCVQASTNTKMINIWRFFVLVVGAPLLPLAAAGDGPANKVGVSRGYVWDFTRC